MDQSSQDNSRPTVNISPNVPMSSPGGSKPPRNPKTIGLIMGIVILLIVIGFGVYAAIRPESRFSLTGEGGIFGELPLSEDQTTQTKKKVARNESGLSGRRCDTPNRRAIGVMLAGDPINRPVSGFAGADLVLEMPVLVSDVTRLTAFYQCGKPSEIGSVRSARHDYLFMAEGWDAILAHWGGSYHALNRIAVGEFQTLNALTNPHNAFFRKASLPAPYNGFTSYEGLWNALQQLGYRQETDFEGYDFQDDPAPTQRGAKGTLTIAWPGQFRVHYEYDPSQNRYQRFWAGTRQVDGEDGTTPVAPSAIAIMRAANTFAEGPGGYNDMAIEGSGEAVVYQNGQEIKGTWEKSQIHKSDPVHFMDQNGNDITFTRGQVWVMAVEPEIPVTWQSAATAQAQTNN